MQSVTPRNGLVLVKILDKKERKTASGIIVPNGMATTFEMAEIVKVGRGILDVGIHVGTDDLHPGQIVLIKSGQQVDMGVHAKSTLPLTSEDGSKVFMLNQIDILLILSEPTPTV